VLVAGCGDADQGREPLPLPADVSQVEPTNNSLFYSGCYCDTSYRFWCKGTDGVWEWNSCCGKQRVYSPSIGYYCR
jgi:hypothetical protein